MRRGLVVEWLGSAILDEMRLCLAILLLVVALSAMAPVAGADSFVDTTPGTMAFAVPTGVSSLSVSATGGAGGNLTNSTGATLVAGGRSALVTGTVAVFPGEQLQLTVAANGGKGNASTGTNGGGGAPDGGAGGYSAGGGGGATRVLDCQGIVCRVAVIAAGGGGAGANGFISVSPTFPTLAGGPGGAAGAPGTDGASDIPVSGGGGGQPGTAGAGGSGGSGSDAGANGTSPTGGGGGNHSGSFNGQEGGGGGGGGVFGGGGGGSGASGMDASANQAYGGGGGGGGGSSLVPSGGNLNTAVPGAAPRIVLTWLGAAGSGPGSGPGSKGGGALAAASRETLSPSAFPAAPSGPSALAAKRSYGTKVTYTLNQAASVRFTVQQLRTGRKVRHGKKTTCDPPTRKNATQRKCTRLVTLRGSFTRIGVAGTNKFRFTGRLNGKRLPPGKYLLVATPKANGKAGRAASASFKIIR